MSEKYEYDNEYDFGEDDELNPTYKKSKHQEILDQIKEVEDTDEYELTSSGTFLPSSLVNNSNEEKSKKKKKEKTDVDDYIELDDDWFTALANMKVKKSSFSGSKKTFGDIMFGKKKKKKKKKDKNELIDYAKEFEPELNLYRNLLADQNKFTDTLQKEYDSIKSSKSSARGINKTMSDLVENITGARSLAMQLVEKNVNAKKLIAELTIKQKKELGAANNEGANMSDFAGSLLNKMINERSQIIGTGDAAEIQDYTEDELYSSLSESLVGEERSDEVNRRLMYENRNITVYVSINDSDTEDYYYYAVDENGIEVPDYPLPLRTNLSINRSTGIATDSYGKKYPITWR